MHLTCAPDAVCADKIIGRFGRQLRRHIEEPLLQLLATDEEVINVATIVVSYLLLFRFLQTAHAEMLKSK